MVRNGTEVFAYAEGESERRADELAAQAEYAEGQERVDESEDEVRATERSRPKQSVSGPVVLSTCSEHLRGREAREASAT